MGRSVGENKGELNVVFVPAPSEVGLSETGNGAGVGATKSLASMSSSSSSASPFIFFSS